MRIRDFLNVSICASILFVSSISNAAIFDRNGNKIPDDQVNSDLVNWQLLESKNNAKYNGVGLIRIGNLGTCTGFFIKTQPDSWELSKLKQKN